MEEPQFLALPPVAPAPSIHPDPRVLVDQEQAEMIPIMPRVKKASMATRPEGIAELPGHFSASSFPDHGSP